MCGIVGVYQFGERDVDPATLSQQVSLLWHRGPDDQAFWHEKKIGLGSTRLAIIDLSPSGSQPMHSPDGRYVIVYNGELYNVESFRDSLTRFRSFRGTSDTEVLLHSLAELGIAAGLPRLEGMFAFALYDRLTKRLWLARDPFGIKPLYYHCNRNRIVFASEIKPLLLDAETPREADYDVLRQYLLLGYAVDPMTAFRGIFRVPPGHYLEVRPDGWHRVIEYWNVVDLMTAPTCDVATAFDEAVRAHSISDVPTGLLLSGGLDSSAILASMARQRLMKDSFRAYNVGLEPHDAIQERMQTLQRAISVRTTNYYGAALTKIDPLSTEMTSTADIALSVEEPIGDASNRLIDAIAATARRDGTIVLVSGHGGDETFAGYRRHVWARYLAWLRQPGIRSISRMLVRTVGGELGDRMASGMVAGDIHPLIGTASIGWGLVAAGAPSADWFPPAKIAEVAAPLTRMIGHWRSFSFLKQMMFLDMRTYLPAQNLINVDKSSMRRSVEVRLPFLYRPLAAIGVQSPDSALIARFKNKTIIRRLARQSMPEFLHSLPKHGFGPPLPHYLNSEGARELLFGRRSSERGLFNQATLGHLYNNVSLTTPHLAAQLSNVSIIQEWFRCFIDENPLKHGTFSHVRSVSLPTSILA